MNHGNMNRLETARQRYIRKHGESSLLDLTNSHFGRAGIVPPEALYQAAFERWRRFPEYRPSGRGGLALRESIAAFMSRPGRTIAPDQVVATAGSSVSYHLLFSRLTAAAATTAATTTTHAGAPVVALPRPGYPLFEELAAGAGVTVVWYDTPPESGFQPDPHEIRKVLAQGARAVVVISPGNPTGVVIDPAVLAKINGFCREYDALLIVDEVFDRFVPTHHPVSAGSERGSKSNSALTVRLNGLSKAFAAPDIKLGWIVVAGGPRGAAESLLHDLDTIHDTFLTVSGFAEAAGPVFLTSAAGQDALKDIRRKVLERRRAMDGMLDDLPALEDYRGTSAVGGIHRLLRIDPVTASSRFGTLDDESIAVALIERVGVYVHPGYLYGTEDAFPERGPWIVVTALHTEKTVAAARDRLHSVFG